MKMCIILQKSHISFCYFLNYPFDSDCGQRTTPKRRQNYWLLQYTTRRVAQTIAIQNDEIYHVFINVRVVFANLHNTKNKVVSARFSTESCSSYKCHVVCYDFYHHEKNSSCRIIKLRLAVVHRNQLSGDLGQ